MKHNTKEPPRPQAGSRILLCEPDATTLMVLRQTFQHLGVQVVAEVQTGEAAVTATRAHMPDYALIDFCLPDMDGVEAAKQILAAVPTCVMIVSTLKTNEIYQRAHEAGVQGILLKPFSKKELTAHFQQMCSHSSE